MRVIISAGGTGGHLYPALALAAALPPRVKSEDILIVTGAGSLERDLVNEAGFKVRALDAPGFRRKLSPELLTNAYKIRLATRMAADIIKEFEPDVVVGFGGAVTFPMLRAAKARRLPTAIQEQNVVPGLANKYLGRAADLIAVAWPEAAAGWPKGRRVAVTGNPVRLDHLELTREAARRELDLPEAGAVVTIFGGSQGALHLNQVIVDVYASLAGEDTTLLHLTGARDYGDIVNAWSAAGANSHVKILPYLDRMGLAYRASDLVICRAGASTLAELAAYGVPSILIPYPYAANDHQAKNAAVFESAGAALVTADTVLTAADLARDASALLADRNKLASMARAAAGIGRPRAAAELADLVIELADKVE
jgi:UDP-N-acetylglucosamine--N-acetylmuramyl-(pentapeptide) pyrophosphoryl-undecaprenol N-acetylglucosamine transferase